MQCRSNGCFRVVQHALELSIVDLLSGRSAPAGDLIVIDLFARYRLGRFFLSEGFNSSSHVSVNFLKVLFIYRALLVQELRNFADDNLVEVGLFGHADVELVAELVN